MHHVKRLEVREEHVTRNYRRCFCTMSIGPLTARGDPQMEPVLPLTLRSMDRQNPQLVGALIPLALPPSSSPSSSLPSRRSSSVAASQLAAALIPVKPGPPRPALSGSLGLSGSTRLPRSSHYPWPERAPLPPAAPGRGNLGIHSQLGA